MKLILSKVFALQASESRIISLVPMQNPQSMCVCVIPVSKGEDKSPQEPHILLALS